MKKLGPVQFTGCVRTHPDGTDFIFIWDAGDMVHDRELATAAADVMQEKLAITGMIVCLVFRSDGMILVQPSSWGSAYFCYADDLLPTLEFGPVAVDLSESINY